MEPPPISRFNSQSTSETFMGNDNGLVSPLLSPVPLHDGSGAQTPIVQTQDSRQWIDLDYLSPKLLRELRRQYDPSIADEPSGPLAKGAARIKAWARQSKQGIQIRLRRKLNAEHDEVTDIHLVPDATASGYEARDDKLPLIAELSGMDNEINELPDTTSTIRQELEASQVQSRTSTGSSVGEPLPRYEPRRGRPTGSVEPSMSDTERTQSPERLSHHLSSPQSSTIAIPTSGFAYDDFHAPGFIGNPPRADSDDKDVQCFEEPARASIAQSLRENLNQAKRQLDEERQVSERLQDIISALQQQHPSQQGDSAKEPPHQNPSNRAKTALERLKVAETTTYETETDVDLPSPIQRRSKKIAVIPRRKKSTTIAKPTNPGTLRFRASSDNEGETGSLLRKQTLPKRLPANANAEDIWASLLRIQSKILGPEHPLTYQAKSDLARSRQNGHVRGSEDLVTLKTSQTLAMDTLGVVHPWVAAFTENLNTLEWLTRSESGTDVGHGRQVSRGDKPTSSTTDDSITTTDNLLQEKHDTTTNEIHEMPNDVPRSVLDGVQNTPPKITTSFHSAEANTSQVQIQQPLRIDSLWDSCRPPHQPRNDSMVLPSLIFGAFLQTLSNSVSLLLQNYGPPAPVQRGKVRVRWTCSCGEQLHDDFIERRHGAARELEAYLNRPRMVTGGNTPTSPSSSNDSLSFANSSFGGLPSSQTSWSSHNFSVQGYVEFVSEMLGDRADSVSSFSSLGSNEDTKPPQNFSGRPLHQYSPFSEPPWLLTCKSNVVCIVEMACLPLPTNLGTEPSNS